VAGEVVKALGWVGAEIIEMTISLLITDGFEDIILIL